MVQSGTIQMTAQFELSFMPEHQQTVRNTGSLYLNTDLAFYLSYYSLILTY